MIVVELAGAPQGKGRPRFARATGRAYTPAATRSYEGALRLAAQEVMAGRAPLDGPIKVQVDARMPIPASWSKKKRAAALDGLVLPTGKPDADNLLKACDAFNEILFRDDRQIVDVTVRKRYSDRPALRVEVVPV